MTHQAASPQPPFNIESLAHSPLPTLHASVVYILRLRTTQEAIPKRKYKTQATRSHKLQFAKPITEMQIAAVLLCAFSPLLAMAQPQALAAQDGGTVARGVGPDGKRTLYRWGGSEADALPRRRLPELPDI